MSGRQSWLSWLGLLGAMGLLCVAMTTGPQSVNAQAQAKKKAQPAPKTAAPATPKVAPEKPKPTENKPQAAPAKPALAIETLFPSNTVLLQSWDGNDAHRKAWEQTAAYQAFEKTGVLALMDKVLEFALAQVGEEGESFRAAYNHIVAKGLTFGVAVTHDPLPLPIPQLVLHGGAPLEPALTAFLKKSPRQDLKFETRDVDGRQVTSTLIPDAFGIEIGWFAEGEHLIVVAGINAIDATIAVLKGGNPNLSANPIWKAQSDKQDGIERSFLGWLDMTALRKAYGAIPLPNSPDSKRPLTANRILSAFGVDSLEHIVVRSGFKGPALSSETTIKAVGPKRGLLAFTEHKPITLKDLPPLPANARWFSASSIDPEKICLAVIDLIKQVAELGPPGTPDQADGFLAMVPQILEFDPLTELFATMDHVLCVYDDAQHGFFGFGAGIAMQVKDEALLKKTLDGLLVKATNLPDVPLTVVRSQKGGAEIVTLQFKNFPLAPAFTVSRGWLVVSLMPQGVESFLLRLDKQLPAWAPDESWQAALKDLPKEFLSITVSDPRQTYPAIIGFLPMILTGVNVALQQSGAPNTTFPITVNDIPPAELIAQPLFPNVHVCTADGNGIICQTRNSAPTIPLIGGGGAASPAILAALVLPAVQQARSAARDTQSRNNLKQIGLAIHNAADTMRHFPTGTHPNADLKPEARLSWAADILPMIDLVQLHGKIDFEKGWEDEANLPALQTRIPVFINPNLPIDGSAKYGLMHYVGIAGIGKDAPTLEITHKRAGIFGYDRVVRFGNIRDGLSNTWMVSEINKDAGPWGAGNKSTIRALTAKPYVNGPDGFGGGVPKKFNILLGDGSVKGISENIDPSVLEALSTIAGGEEGGGVGE